LQKTLNLKYEQAMSTNSTLPLVSIVMATYNGERYLQEQLDSLARQTYQNIEVIAIDDCSTDGTLDILNRFKAAHKNVTVVRNERNIGYQKNFEKGFLLAAGDYIAPCDQDDVWLESKVETLVRHIGSHAIAYGNSAYIDSEGTLLGKTNRDNFAVMNFDDPMMCVVGACAPGHSILVTRQLVSAAMPFPTVVSHDTWLGFVATFNSSLLFVDEVLVHWRRHDSNVFNRLSKKTKSERESRQECVRIARQRVKLFYDKCPAHLTEQKLAYGKLCKSYESYSLANNFTRMSVFFKYRKQILAYKKRNELRRWLYSFKAFFKII
jgi:glycosyltransferase involved in cell wall biosynthesis